MGDINIDVSSNDPYAEDFETLLLICGSSNFESSPPRVILPSATLLDICALYFSPYHIKTGIFFMT